jgi:predicted transcriptional regulator
MDFAFRISTAQERLIASLTALDMRVMRMLWAQGPRNVRQLHAQLSGDYQALTAALSRLVQAGLLMPESPPSGLSYSYRPTLGREEFLTLCGPRILAQMGVSVRERALGE